MLPRGRQIHSKSSFYESFHQNTPKWVDIAAKKIAYILLDPLGCSDLVHFFIIFFAFLPYFDGFFIPGTYRLLGRKIEDKSRLIKYHILHRSTTCGIDRIVHV